MPDVTRTIGLSLGADLCWPICFEDIVRELDPVIRLGADTLRFEVERVSIEPFGLQPRAHYDVVIDRLTHWYDTSREWIKKAVLMDGMYVYNNPWSVQSMEKQTSYCAMLRLGFPIPRTWLIPPKEYEDLPDLEPTLSRYAKLFDLGEVGEQVGYPLFMKPYDGGGWVGVTRIENEQELRQAYDESGRLVMHHHSPARRSSMSALLRSTVPSPGCFSMTSSVPDLRSTASTAEVGIASPTTRYSDVRAGSGRAGASMASAN